MSLAAPEDLDPPAEPDTVETNTGASGGSDADAETTPDFPTVEMYGEEMELGEALTIVTDAVEDPDNFGLVSAERVDALEEAVQQKDERIAQLKEQVAELHEAFLVAADKSDVPQMAWDHFDEPTEL